MKVQKRNGQLEDVSFDKIKKRIEVLATDLDTNYVKVDKVAQKVISGLTDGIKTSDLDVLAAETCASMATLHPDYNKLASRICVSNLHKTTPESFSDAMRQLYLYVNPITGENAGLISQGFLDLVMDHERELNEMIVHQRDFSFDFFGFKTLERAYLLKCGKKIVERPQYMWLRVALAIHGEELEKVKQTYELMSKKVFTHATPTLFNAGTNKQQLSSCFLLDMDDDSISGIYKTLSDCAKISQSAGGIGLNIHSIRSKGSYIKGTGGTSNGIVPMLRVYNDTARYVDQGGGRRKGSFAVYLETWHSDIFEFLDLKKNHGKEELRARDLFYAMWISDLFMQRVEQDGDWTLFCPNEAKQLHETYGEEFEALYVQYEKEGLGRKTVKARDVWMKIMESQIETGTPYMLYKDAANKKSNQKNLGTIKSSNLCTEILEYTSPDEVAVCNLASIALSQFVVGQSFDFKGLHKTTKVVTENLNKVIDINYYPVPEAKNSNLKHRPIGIGVQGLADVFAMLRIPFDSEEAKELNKQIFEVIYYAALKTSCDVAKRDGHYQTFKGSPASSGILQFDMWDAVPTYYGEDKWNELKEEIKMFGLRNSLLVAPMPTASTSQILGNNECFEPFTSNIYTRRTLAGEYIVINKYLLSDLIELGVWDEDLKQALIANNGSIQSIEGIPQELKDLYKTSYEIKQRHIIDMAADRGAFICQSQSMNLFVENPNFAKLTSMHFHAWRKGLKTGMYYLRSKAAVDPIKFTLSEKYQNKFNKESNSDAGISCSLDNPDDCLMCGS